MLVLFNKLHAFRLGIKNAFVLFINNLFGFAKHLFVSALDVFCDFAL